MSFSFQCTTCNEIHKGLPSFGPDAPHSYDILSDLDQENKAVLGSDNCIIENEYFFVRGRLELPIHGFDRSFVWLVWCSLSRESYELWADSFDKLEREHIGPFFGWLNTDLPFYENTLNLATSVRLVDGGIRPSVDVYEAEHGLYFDQTNRISVAKAEQFVHDLLHPR